MRFDTPWRLPGRERENALLLLRIYETKLASPGVQQQILGSFTLPRSAEEENLRHLHRLGWLELRDVGDSVQFNLLIPGELQAQEFARLRDNPMSRRISARDALLAWTSESEAGARFQDFANSDHAWLFGKPHSPAEAEQAARYLAQKGLLEVSEIDEAMLRVSATADGHELAESGRSVRDIANQYSTYNDNRVSVANNAGPVNFQAHSPNSTLNVTLTDHQCQSANEIAGRLDALLAELDAAADPQDLPDDIREAVKYRSVRLLRRCLTASLAFVAGAASSAAAEVLSSDIGILLHQL